MACIGKRRHRHRVEARVVGHRQGTKAGGRPSGGLVAQGRRVEVHLERALDLARLCSNDPVCAGHAPNDEHGDHHLEGAACHGCLYLAEVSCERMNRMLDRALVVPIIDQPSELAFFGDVT
jgi:hypothetical protein